MRSRLRAIGRWGGLWGGLLLVLGAVNLQVLQKQSVLDDGRTVLLALRPVDPRPLTQGDYTVRRYAEALVPQVDAAPEIGTTRGAEQWCQDVENPVGAVTL